MKAIINENEYVWEMSRHYDHDNTAFIWVEREKTISNLTREPIQSRPRGWHPPAGTYHGPKKLFLMKPIGMSALPDWCNVKTTFKPRKGDTHEWSQIIKPTNNPPRLESIDKPIALIKERSDWRLIFEDDNPRISHESRCQMNLLDYGLRGAVSNLTIIPLEALNSSLAS